MKYGMTESFTLISMLIFGAVTKSYITRMFKSNSGEPYAGKLHVRFLEEFISNCLIIREGENLLMHCVLSSHRGLPSAKLFTELDRMKKGDVFYLHVYDRVLAYQVDNIAIVEPNDYGLLEIEEGKDLCTLFTCTPYGINTHRLLVRGHRVENVLDEKNLTADAARVNPLVVASIIGLILYGIGYVVYRIRKRGV